MQEISEKNDDALTRSKYIGSNYHLACIYISFVLFHCSYFFFIGFTISLLQSHFVLSLRNADIKNKDKNFLLSQFSALIALPSSSSIKIPLLLNLLSHFRNHSEKHVKPPFPSRCWEEIHVQGEKKCFPGHGRFMSHYHEHCPLTKFWSMTLKSFCRSCHHLL